MFKSKNSSWKRCCGFNGLNLNILSVLKTQSKNSEKKMSLVKNKFTVIAD